MCPFVTPLVGALSLSLWSRSKQVLPVCILPRLHVEGRVCRQCGGMSFRYPFGPGVLIKYYPFAYYLDYMLKGKFAGGGGIAVCSVIPSVRALSLSLRSRRPHQLRAVGIAVCPFVMPFGRGPFVIYPFGRGPFRLGCTQTCLLHIGICWPRSFLLYGLFVLFPQPL